MYESSGLRIRVSWLRVQAREDFRDMSGVE